MSKINNQSNSLDKVKFVRDIDTETAANYSGGVSLAGASEKRGGALVGGGDPDLIVYLDANEGWLGLTINSATGKGIDDLGNAASVFNDRISSFTIRRGRWRFYENSTYRGIAGRRSYGPGVYNVTPRFNDSISSLRRVG